MSALGSLILPAYSALAIHPLRTAFTRYDQDPMFWGIASTRLSTLNDVPGWNLLTKLAPNVTFVGLSAQAGTSRRRTRIGERGSSRAAGAALNPKISYYYSDSRVLNTTSSIIITYNKIKTQNSSCHFTTKTTNYIERTVFLWGKKHPDYNQLRFKAIPTLLFFEHKKITQNFVIFQHGRRSRSYLLPRSTNK